MLRLSELCIVESRDALKDIPEGRVLINTINAHSFNVAQKDELFAEALANGDYLIPDGGKHHQGLQDAEGEEPAEGTDCRMGLVQV
jgi:UDP-N-acetyl-D-mannosaminuronic acid transferase (WecB/TagA/CpsF family)